MLMPAKVFAQFFAQKSILRLPQHGRPHLFLHYSKKKRNREQPTTFILHVDNMYCGCLPVKQSVEQVPFDGCHYNCGKRQGLNKAQAVTGLGPQIPASKDIGQQKVYRITLFIGYFSWLI